MNIEVKILSKHAVPVDKLVYVVMGARYSDKWIFVRHRDRVTWEMPAGHIEAGETPDEAAEREIWEETGAEEFDVQYLLDYSVKVNHKEEYGRLYFADVKNIGDILAYEINEITLVDEIPLSLTYPEVQALLFKEARNYFQNDLP